MIEKDFFDVFQPLRMILNEAASQMQVKQDDPGLVYLIAPYPDIKGRELYFGGAQIKKNYVSFHLMPVYMHPELLDGISPQLLKRMQGKSCFNFTKVDETLFGELSQLTQQSLNWFKQNARTFEY